MRLPIGTPTVADNGFRPHPPEPNEPNDPNAGYATEAYYTSNALNQYPRVIFEGGPGQRFNFDADP